MLKVIRTSFNFLWQNLTSHDTDDVTRGNFDDRSRNAKARVIIY